MRLKKVFFFFFVFSFLIFNFLPAGAAVIPEKNPICWSKEECISKIKSMFDTIERPEDHWEKGGPDNVCENLGVCYPAAQVKAQISIGGSTQFSDIGDYIKKIYVYLMYIGGTLASIILLIGGFLWLTSAGSPDRVKSAQGYISGSILGLFLLLGSYTLLYTINPDLVRLKLPQVYLVKNIPLGTKWCKDLPDGNKVAYGSQFTFAGQIASGSFTTDPKIGTSCKYKYFWRNEKTKEDSGEQTCWGSGCPVDSDGTISVCIERTANSFTCQRGNLSGSITGTKGNWEYPWVISDVDTTVVGVCNDGSWEVSYKDASLNFPVMSEKEQRQTYTITLGSSFFSTINKACGADRGGLKGYALSLYLNDNEILGTDQKSYVGRNSDGKCTYPIYNLTTAKDKQCQDQNFGNKKECLKNAPQNFFLTEAELKKGTICDIEVTDGTFGK